MFETKEEALKYLNSRHARVRMESLYLARRKVLQEAQRNGWGDVVVAVQRAETLDNQTARTV